MLIPRYMCPWVQGMPSPCYTKKSHVALREFCKKWSAENKSDVFGEWDRKAVADDSIFKEFATDWLLMIFVSGVKVSEKFYDMAGGLKLPAGIDAED